MKKSLILIILPLLLAAGCGNDIDPVVVEPSLEDLVIANCYIVQQAAEDFAAQNGGQYSQNLYSDTTLAGDTLVDLLPGGILLENPFNQSRSVPTDGSATSPGQTGYVPSWIGGTSQGYIITGYGAEVLIITLGKPSYLEYSVIGNCYTVQQAVEAFAAADNGEYPGNVDADTTLNGDTVIDLLPGGTLLENPFTKFLSEPVDGSAALPGVTAYLPADSGGIVVNYAITGYGENNMFFLLTRDTTLVWP